MTTNIYIPWKIFISKIKFYQLDIYYKLFDQFDIEFGQEHVWKHI